MAEYFNQNQVLDHLGLKDYRTLKRWCRETIPVIEPRTRNGYGPSLWYTGTQLRKLEKVAEAHGRAVRRSTAEEEQSLEESTPTALLSSLLGRLETVEGKIDGLGLAEGETLAALIEREVKRQLQARTCVAKVSMRSSSSEEGDGHTGDNG